VLKGITLKIVGGEKVGVVGRTGSGKSSNLLLIFRALHRKDNDRSMVVRLEDAVSVLCNCHISYNGMIRSAKLWRSRVQSFKNEDW